MSWYTFDVESVEFDSHGKALQGRYWQVGWDHPMWAYSAQLYSVDRGDDLERRIIGGNPQ